MESPLSFNTANADVIKKYADEAGRFSDVRFMQFEQDAETSFYLLPPWCADSGLLSREIWEMFLPDKKRWTAWRSWNYINPEFGASDPVTQFVDWIKQQPNVEFDELKRHLPKARYYANVLIAGTKKIPGGQFQAFPKPLEIQTLNMPSTVWNGICAKMQEPGFDVPYDPNQAILFVVIRTGRGLQTEYKVDFAGTRGATGEIVPNRYNLVEHFGVDKIKTVISELPNLDERWKAPKSGDNDLLSKAEEAKRALKTKFLSTAFDPASAGARAIGGGQQFGGAQQNTAPPVTGIAPTTAGGAKPVTETAPVAPSVEIAPSSPSPVGGVPTPNAAPEASVAQAVATPGVAVTEAVAVATTPIPVGLQTDIPAPTIPEAPQVNL